MDRGVGGGYSPRCHKESDTTEHTQQLVEKTDNVREQKVKQEFFFRNKRTKTKTEAYYTYCGKLKTEKIFKEDRQG